MKDEKYTALLKEKKRIESARKKFNDHVWQIREMSDLGLIKHPAGILGRICPECGGRLHYMSTYAEAYYKCTKCDYEWAKWDVGE